MDKQEAIEYLQKLLKPGDTVYTDLKHVSRSGMYRRLTVYVIRGNEPIWITSRVASACDMRYDREHETIGVSGCGMDMGFHVVYNLSYVLFPKGHECIGSECPSNDHSNGDRNYTPHRHNDGGYALRHKWL